MILVFPAETESKDSQLDTRFGRCNIFLAYNTKTGAIETKSNAQNINAAQGAGIQAAVHVADLNADVLICGHCGPKAYKTLSVANIRVVTGQKGKISDLIDKFQRGEMSYSQGADVEGHWV